MNVLATRILSYTDENGDEKDLVLTVFEPVEREGKDPTCAYSFGSPLTTKLRDDEGIDFISAFLRCLGSARAILKTYDLGRRAHWRGMADCGLPERAQKPPSWAPPDLPPPREAVGSMGVLTSRRLHGRGEGDAGKELLLTIFVPSIAEGETWTCGFSFGAPGSEPIRYGVGDDFIEALLDALAMARVAFEGRVPKGWGWSASEELQDCADLPYKIGRSFRTEPLRDRLPVPPDVSAA